MKGVLNTGWIAAASCFLAVLPASAQEFREVDLDGRAPAERIYAGVDGFNVVMWNATRGEWIDLFRAKGGADAVAVGAAEPGGLASLTVDGRTWGWRSSRYVPLPEMPKDGTGAPADVARLAFEAAGSTMQPGDGIGFSYKEQDGSTAYFVPVEDPAICSAWLCGGAVVRDGVAGTDIGAIVGDVIGPSREVNAQGHRMIEQIKDGELLVMDPDGKAETKIVPGMAAKVADPQPTPPEG